jgi:hypothetical protein
LEKSTHQALHSANVPAVAHVIAKKPSEKTGVVKGGSKACPAPSFLKYK